MGQGVMGQGGGGSGQDGSGRDGSGWKLEIMVKEPRKVKL